MTVAASTRWVQPVTLEGRIVRLEPLDRRHLDDLARVAFEPSIWQWTLARPADRAGLEAWLETALANREAKLLQLGHAFETLRANRVEFKTDSRNEPSRTALLGIGATFEGIFRNHMVMPDGPLRHSAYYSVIAEEWPSVRARLEANLARHG